MKLEAPHNEAGLELLLTNAAAGEKRTLFPRRKTHFSNDGQILMKNSGQFPLGKMLAFRTCQLFYCILSLNMFHIVEQQNMRSIPLNVQSD